MERETKHRVAGLSASLSYDEADQLVRAFCARVRPVQGREELGLLEALGRVLAEPVIADRDQPPFHRSTRDGFACRADAASSWMRLMGTLNAGRRWTGAPLRADEAVEIMTGAPLPDGADCVVMLEHVEHDTVGPRVRLLAGRKIAAGDNVVPTGAEAAAGAVLVPAGALLGASQTAAAASVGAARLRVYARPRVAILATGDELVDAGQTPLPHQIHNSNSYVLAALVQEAGGVPVLAPPVRDTTEALALAVRAAVSASPRADLLLLTGGVSMGKYDLVEAVLAELGAEFFFTGVRMQPGKPVVFGALPREAAPIRVPQDETGAQPAILWFGLPGNPVSTMVTFSLFAAPVVAALAGRRGYSARFAEARLHSPVEGKPDLRRFLPALLRADAGGTEVEPVSWQGSGDVAATATANCLLVVPEGARLGSGDMVRVLLL